MSKKSSKYDAWRRYSGLAVVIFVVVGIAMISIVAEKYNKTADSRQETTDDIQQESQSSGPALMMLDANGTRLLSLNGSSTRDIRWPDDVSRLGQPLSQVVGAEVQTGQTVWLDAGFIKTPPTVFRAPDGRHDERMTDARGDGAGSIELTQGNESQLLVLRQKNGRNISNAQLLGWIDKDAMAVVGVATTTRDIFSFDVNGTLTPVAYLPDDAWLIKVAAGYVYYARATLGPGIESPQMAPSSIWRVSLSGKPEEIVEEPLKVIQNFAVADEGLSYSLEDGSLKSVSNGSAHDLGQGRLVMRIAGQGTLILRDGAPMLVKDDGASEPLDIIPVGSIFYLSNASY
ncbi:MAG: hypothetical protein WCT54_05540 [Patescibacteria group bacterium]